MKVQWGGYVEKDWKHTKRAPTSMSDSAAERFAETKKKIVAQANRYHSSIVCIGSGGEEHNRESEQRYHHIDTPGGVTAIQISHMHHLSGLGTNAEAQERAIRPCQKGQNQ
eukprot:NODE_477_length_7951_cov_0.254075.p4 type:complete len:111 gc:universal NODE_477_length_7951_cov_0.254075:3159-2827(-)